MQQPNTLLDQARLRETLTMVLDHAMPACARVGYRLVGTGAALLHGAWLVGAFLSHPVWRVSYADGGA